MKKSVRMISAALVSVFLLLSCSAALADFSNMAPAGAAVKTMAPSLLSVFKDGAIDTTTSKGRAAFLVTAVLSYMQENESFSVDTAKAMFFGISLGCYAGAFQGENGDYICVLYNSEDDTAAWYKMDAGKSSEAMNAFKSAMPNNDCTEISSSDFSSVVDQLYNSTK